jgi:hypothetical protein
MKTLRMRAAEERAKIFAQDIIESETDESAETFSGSATDLTWKANSKLPAIDDLEPAITELIAAHHVRSERESTFEGPIIDEDSVPDYIALIRREILHRLRSIPYQAYEVGNLLYIIKSQLPHGKFDAWISKFLPISKTTSLNFMRVYRTCLGHPEILEYFKQSVLYQICAPSFPPDFRRFIFENISGPLDVKNKDLLKVAIKWKSGEVTPKSPEVLRLLKKNRFESEAKNYIDELTNLEKVLKGSANKINAYNRINDPHPFLSEDDNEKDKKFDKIESMILGFIGQISSVKQELKSDQ